jgi:hypothetical protein
MILQLPIATFRTMPPNEINDQRKEAMQQKLIACGPHGSWHRLSYDSRFLIQKRHLQHTSTDDCAGEEILFRLWDRLYDEIFAESLR